MVKDRSGRELEKGHIVHIPCRVVDVQDHEEHCNVTVETLHGTTEVEDGPVSRFALNGRQLDNLLDIGTVSTGPVDAVSEPVAEPAKASGKARKPRSTPEDQDQS